VVLPQQMGQLVVLRCENALFGL